MRQDAGTVVEAPLAGRHVAQGAASVGRARAARVLTATTRERDVVNEMTVLGVSETKVAVVFLVMAVSMVKL